MVLGNINRSGAAAGQKPTALGRPRFLATLGTIFGGFTAVCVVLRPPPCSVNRNSASGPGSACCNGYETVFLYNLGREGKCRVYRPTERQCPLAGACDFCPRLCRGPRAAIKACSCGLPALVLHMYRVRYSKEVFFRVVSAIAPGYFCFGDWLTAHLRTQKIKCGVAQVFRHLLLVEGHCLITEREPITGIGAISFTDCA